MIRRTPAEKARDLALAKTVLSRWRFRQGPTLRQLCAEVGIPYGRFVKFAHWHNGLSMNLKEPVLAAKRRERRSVSKIKPQKNPPR